jgi:exopolysaccharide biosynthesis polyprenyl glycosylphosphotransferase
MSESPLAIPAFGDIRRGSPEVELSLASADMAGVRRISRLTCAGVRFAIDLLLAQASAVLAYVAGGPAAESLSVGKAAEMLVIVGLAPVIGVLSLWRRGVYTVSGPGPRLGGIMSGWLLGSGLVILGICVLQASGMLAEGHRHVITLPPALPAFVIIGGGAVVARQALWLTLWPRLAGRLAGIPAIVAGAGAFAYAERLRAQGGATQIAAIVPELEAGADDIVALVRRGAVRSVFVMLPHGEEDTALSLVAKLAAFPVAVRGVLDMPRLGAQSRGVSMEAGFPLIHIADPPLGLAAECLKRAEDIVLSTLLLPATAPLMLLASIAVKLETPGPVLFRQPRHGLNGAEINVLKFRTMYAHCEDRQASRQTLRGDPRVTRVGAFLRRHSLDELPQLFNVLAGTMSLVGPRPHAPATAAAGRRLDSAIANYPLRHRVKPGITGWAQVSGCRGNLDTLEKAVRRVEHDLYYIENWSLLFDLWILVKTIRAMLHDAEAF